MMMDPGEVPKGGGGEHVEGSEKRETGETKSESRVVDEVSVNHYILRVAESFKILFKVKLFVS